jgi:hypothetical protein
MKLRMSCPCLIPEPDYPEAAQWGPLLWCILHGLAEKAGTCTTPMFLDDERRYWIHFFKETGEIIPCPTCKMHYMEYLKTHPVNALKTLPHSQRKAWITKWFWELHNDVNARLGKPIFPIENLSATYGNMNLHETLGRLEAPLKLAIKITGTHFLKYVEWKRRVTMLFSIFGI